MPTQISASLRGLFSVCAAVAALDYLVGEKRAAASYRSLCALALAVCAARTALGWLRV